MKIKPGETTGALLPTKRGAARRGAWGRAICRAAALAAALAAVAGCGTVPRRWGERDPGPSASPSSSPSSSASSATSSSPAAGDHVQSRTVGDGTVFRAKATNRQRFQVHLDFGRVFATQGDFDHALQEYKDALAVAESRENRREFNDADRALAHRRIAVACDRLGRFKQSEPHFQAAIKLEPKNVKNWNDSGYSYYLQGRFKEAEKAFRSGLKRAPDDARARTNLGMVLAALGRSSDALSVLCAPQGDAIGHANLGYLLAASGQYAPAREQYKKALSLRPDLELARRALAQIDRQAQASNRPAPAAAEKGRAIQAGKSGPAPAAPVSASASASAVRKRDPQIQRASLASASKSGPIVVFDGPDDRPAAHSVTPTAAARALSPAIAAPARGPDRGPDAERGPVARSTPRQLAAGASSRTVVLGPSRSGEEAWDPIVVVEPERAYETLRPDAPVAAANAPSAAMGLAVLLFDHKAPGAADAAVQRGEGGTKDMARPIDGLPELPKLALARGQDVVRPAPVPRRTTVVRLAAPDGPADGERRQPAREGDNVRRPNTRRFRIWGRIHRNRPHHEWLNRDRSAR